MYTYKHIFSPWKKIIYYFSNKSVRKRLWRISVRWRFVLIRKGESSRVTFDPVHPSVWLLQNNIYEWPTHCRGELSERSPQITPRKPAFLRSGKRLAFFSTGDNFDLLVTTGERETTPPPWKRKEIKEERRDSVIRQRTHTYTWNCARKEVHRAMRDPPRMEGGIYTRQGLSARLNVSCYQ